MLLQGMLKATFEKLCIHKNTLVDKIGKFSCNRITCFQKIFVLPKEITVFSIIYNIKQFINL